MKLVTMTKRVFNYYKENVKGNENATYDQVQRKLTRNMLLAYKPDSSGYSASLYCYGSLHFLVNTEGKVVWIKNKCKIPDSNLWQLDKKKYVELSKELGIEDADTYSEKVKKDIKHFVKRKVNKVKRALNINKTNNEKVSV